MRATLLILVICAGHGLAAADAKTRELAQGYQKELTGCRTRADGVTKVAAGAQALVDDGQHQHESDLATLRAGLAQVQAYCAELTATLEILNADANARYRTLERKLDEQDNKIRKLRQGTKKVLDDLAPVISRMIPLINARAGAAAPPPSRVHIEFPSKRAIDVPVLAGAYTTSGSEAADIIDYAERKASATVSTRLVASATCEQQRQAITASASDVPVSDAIRSLGLAWYVAYVKPGRRVRVACRASKAGAILAALDEPAGVTGWPDIEPVLAAMIAVRP